MGVCVVVGAGGIVEAGTTGVSVADTQDERIRDAMKMEIIFFMMVPKKKVRSSCGLVLISVLA
jgi:hypothetical protein